MKLSSSFHSVSHLTLSPSLCFHFCLYYLSVLLFLIPLMSFKHFFFFLLHLSLFSFFLSQYVGPYFHLLPALSHFASYLSFSPLISVFFSPSLTRYMFALPPSFTRAQTCTDAQIPLSLFIHLI